MLSLSRASTGIHMGVAKLTELQHFYLAKNTVKLTYSTVEFQMFSGEDPRPSLQREAKNGGGDRMGTGQVG